MAAGNSRVFLIRSLKGAVYAVKNVGRNGRPGSLESGVEETGVRHCVFAVLERVAGYAGKNFRSRLRQGIPPSRFAWREILHPLGASFSDPEFLDEPGSFQTDKEEEQPSRDIPMPFARDRLMIDQDNRRNVSQPVKQFPSLPAQFPDRPIVAGRREHHQDAEPGQTKPGKRFGKTLQQILPIALVEHMTGEMDQTINAGGNTDITAMPIERADNGRTREEYP